jgi:hypothetical protein
MKRALTLLIATAALALAGPASANDSVAVTAAGGLVLVPNDAIDMVSEDLYVSRREVRVRYVFRNRAPAPVRVTVAFPMPDRDLAIEEEGDVAWPADFHTRVAGREVPMRVERRALLGGADHSALLARLGVPVAGRGGEDAMFDALDALAPADQDRLAALGLVELSGEPGTGRRHAAPRWTVKETWHWNQTFPVGRDLVVEHRYRPGVGGTVATALGSREIRAGDYGREMIERYCIDDDLIATVDRIARRSEGAWVPLAETWLSYILTTGANWRSPIGEFRLVVDKGDPNVLVSFCGEGVRRISPTQFEVRHRNWRPTRDLHVLFLVPIGG